MITLQTYFEMKGKVKRISLKILKITGISVLSVLLLMFLLPFLFPGTIAAKVKALVNRSITSKVEFKEAKLSFFKHFPSLTLTLQGLSLTGSPPFGKDILVNAKELSFGINLFSLFSNSVKINQVFLGNAKINVQVDEQGNANYNVYRSTPGTSSDTSSSEAGLKLEKIVIEKSDLVYDDRSIPMKINARNFNYTGKGDLSEAIFDLASRLSAGAFSFQYAGETYVNQKPFRAKLITKINTKSLSLIFGDNLARINQLPLKFSGRFDFLQHGYNVDLNIESRKATLKNIITAIPPDMTGWLDNTKVKGDAFFGFSLKGKYDAEAGLMPELRSTIKIDNGYIAYKKAPQPVKDLVLRLNVKLPSLKTDSLDIRIDTFNFNVGKGYFRMNSHSVGLENPDIESSVNVDLDLNDWSSAIGMKDLELKGKYRLDLKAKGKFSRGQDSGSWRKNIVITSIPSYTLASSLRNGFLKFSSLPESLSNISFDINSSCADNNYRNAKLDVENINFTALKSILKGYIKTTNLMNPQIDADIAGNIRLQELAQFIPMKDLALAGDLAIDIKGKGTYDRMKKEFPVISANLKVNDGEVRTAYYPNPITHIQVQADLENKTGNLSSTKVSLTPVNFEFEGRPFTLTADLSDPENLSYDIVSKGTLDIGRLYKVFGIPGYDATGIIKADISLKGKQSDVTAGRYQALNNSGQLEFNDVIVRSSSFSRPFLINSGIFRFDRDKAWLENFKTTFGSNQLSLSGYFSNLVNYVLQDNAKLKGNLNLSTGHLNLDEFTAFENPEQDPSAAGTDSAGNGVIMIPKDLALQFNARVGQADYQGVSVKDFNGQMMIDSGKVKLNKTSFRIADAPFALNAVYEGVNPHRGLFDINIKADSFSIEKAYNDIPVFREMASSASGVKGIAGLDYDLSGRLDQNMRQVFPSLKGGGVLTLKKVKLKGFKLMNAVSRSTEHKELADPDLSGIKVKTTVKNNIITLERTKLRIAGFRPRFEGQVSLDGKLNIKGRLGLPPFGIFGIPFNVSGTSENPVVKLKRDKSGKVLEEKEDTDDEDINDLPVPETQQNEN